MMWGYNMFDTCAPNKGWSDGISDLEELGSWDCGVEPIWRKCASSSWCSLEIRINARC